MINVSQQISWSVTLLFFNRTHSIISEMKRKIEILHCNYKFLIWIKNKLLLMKCGAVIRYRAA